MKKIAPLFLLGCFVALSCTKKEAKYKTETIDGVRVIRNLAVKPDDRAAAHRQVVFAITRTLRIFFKLAEVEGAKITRECLSRGLLVNIVQFPGSLSVWRIAPPLTTTRAEIDRALGIIESSIRAVVGG